MLATILAVLLWTVLAAEAAIRISGDEMNLGTVTLFDKENFGGHDMTMPIFKAATCYNLECYFLGLGSATWKLAPDGADGDDAHNYFFQELDCLGYWDEFNVRTTDLVAQLSNDLANRVGSILVTRRYLPGARPHPEAITNCTGAMLHNMHTQIIP